MISYSYISSFISRQRPLIIASFFLVSVTGAVYFQVGNFDYVTFDDDLYVYGNKRISQGLTYENLLWAVTTSHAYNWHPLTWLSLMADASLFGSHPGVHHLVNVFFHAMNSLLLFLVLMRMSGQLWRCFFVAAMFALHPLHVESVAWISERKDVLSAFFWMLTMMAYQRYVLSLKTGRYLVVILFLVLGLLAKPINVTLPFVLLLMDFWPLHRFGHPDCPGGSIVRVIVDKLPMLLISLIFCLVTFMVQKNSGMVQSMGLFPLDTRIANAFVSYAAYLWDMVWPWNLAIFYPHPQKVALIQAVLAGIMIGSVTLVSVRFIHKAPYLTVGWFWYIVTLVPVIGIIQVGLHARADRYTYLPLTGIFMIIAWGLPEVLRGFRLRNGVLAFSAAAVLTMYTAATWVQIGYWKNSLELYSHAISAVKDNYGAHCGLAGVLMSSGHTDAAISHYRESVRIRPDYMLPRFNLGVILFNKHRYDEAIEQFQHVASYNIYPNPEAHLYLGRAFAARDNIHEAISHFSTAVHIDPRLEQAQALLRKALLTRAGIEEEIRGLEDRQGKNPLNILQMNRLAVLYSSVGENDRAISYIQRMLEMQPGNPSLYYNLACLYAREKRLREAEDYLRQAVEQGFHRWDLIRYDPDLTGIRNIASVQALLRDLPSQP